MYAMLLAPSGAQADKHIKTNAPAWPMHWVGETIESELFGLRLDIRLFVGYNIRIHYANPDQLHYVFDMFKPY